ncbi:MAG: NAD(P)-binding domain-containing protein [Anaeromyxobacter sp.]
MDIFSLSIVAALAFVTAVAGIVHVARRGARPRRDEELFEEKKAKGAHLAKSLHPVIDTDICIGSLSCLKACPEGDILGVVDGAARLVHGDHCIGHGKCAVECPVHAIRLVFGSSERGIDLPEVDEFFESSRPGLHVVGELGGMGLIKNALTQGLQVADRIAELVGKAKEPVVIVGAGPAGIATAVGLKSKGVPHRLLEQLTVGGSVAHYPRRKVTMTETVELPGGAGRVGKARISKEELLETWQKVLSKVGVRVEEGVKVNEIEGEDGNFTVKTSQGTLKASKVVLAIGRRGTPRKLAVPGESAEKVLYGLKDPEQFDGEKVLVVGGGDAALEAAIQLAEESTAEVTLSYRGAELGRCREANRKKFGQLVTAGKIRALLPSVVTNITEKSVDLNKDGTPVTLPNTFIIVNIGGELPTEFLAKVGITMRRFHGEGLGDTGPNVVIGGNGMLPRALARPKTSRGRIAARLGYVAVGAAILAWLAWVGRDYYPLDRAGRLASPEHPSLKSAGTWGHSVGIAATVFMLSNFLYAARKRWKSLSALGQIVSWLDFHVFVGFMSPLVIAYHAAFQSNNLLATGTATSLVVVVTTGIIGRFIYGIVPGDGGKSLELSELLGHFERLRDSFTDIPERASVSAHELIAKATAPVKTRFLAVLFLELPAGAMWLRIRLFFLRFKFDDKLAFKSFKLAILKLETLRWQIRFYGSLKRLLRTWRTFHASLAVLLVLVIAAHIGLSLYLGYGLLHR